MLAQKSEYIIGPHRTGGISDTAAKLVDPRMQNGAEKEFRLPLHDIAKSPLSREEVESYFEGELSKK